MKTISEPLTTPLSRRQILQGSACGFGALALAALLTEKATAATRQPPVPHFKPHAKRVIFLFMQGGPSHMDLFDFKPRLTREGGRTLPYSLPETEATVGLENTRLLAPVAPFSRRGRCGLLMSDLLPHIGGQADELCLLRAVHSDTPNHPTATALIHTGVQNEIRPSMGAWVSYGLGMGNADLPGFVTIMPSNARTYGSAFLPAKHQGTAIQSVGNAPGKAPIRHLFDPSLEPLFQRKRLDLLEAMNRRQLARLERDQQVEGLIESFELAFRMQAETPKLVSLARESKATLDLYGVDEAPTDTFARQCLLARRFAEAGVRFVQVNINKWDHHGKIHANLRRECATTDKPVAGLLADLKNRGLLDDTLVIWGGEFGRTPHTQDFSGKKNSVGREHNHHGFSMWLAGGGVKAGFSHGHTDDYAYRAVEGKVHVHDLQATILHLLGLDHERLTYRHAGRDFRLTDVFGQVVEEILA